MRLLKPDSGSWDMHILPVQVRRSSRMGVVPLRTASRGGSSPGEDVPRVVLAAICDGRRLPSWQEVAFVTLCQWAVIWAPQRGTFRHHVTVTGVPSRSGPLEFVLLAIFATPTEITVHEGLLEPQPPPGRFFPHPGKVGSSPTHHINSLYP